MDNRQLTERVLILELPSTGFAPASLSGVAMVDRQSQKVAERIKLKGLIDETDNILHFGIEIFAVA